MIGWDKIGRRSSTVVGHGFMIVLFEGDICFRFFRFRWSIIFLFLNFKVFDVDLDIELSVKLVYLLLNEFNYIHEIPFYLESMVGKLSRLYRDCLVIEMGFVSFPMLLWGPVDMRIYILNHSRGETERNYRIFVLGS